MSEDLSLEFHGRTPSMVLAEIPQKGWFIDARGTVVDTMIYHNGQPVPRVQSVKVEVSVEKGKTTTITFYGGDAIVLHAEEDHKP